MPFAVKTAFHQLSDAFACMWKDNRRLKFHFFRCSSYRVLYADLVRSVFFPFFLAIGPLILTEELCLLLLLFWKLIDHWKGGGGGGGHFLQ